MSEPVNVVVEENAVADSVRSIERSVTRGYFVASSDAMILVAEVKRLRAREAAILKLHTTFPIYQECGHDGDCPTESFEVDGEFHTCEEGFMYFICSECCVVNDYQHEDCAGGHDHGKDKPRCGTFALLTNPQGDTK